MSIEVQKAPLVSQIVLDQNKDDLHFSLDESGVITNSTSKKPASSFTKSKQTSYNKSETMASKYSDGYDSYDDDFEDDIPVRNGSRTRTTRERKPSSFHSDYSYTPSPPTTRRNTKNISSRRNSLVSYRSAYGPSRATNKPSKKAKKSLSASTRPPKTDDNSTMVKKILSANRNKITKLYNVVEELQQEVDNLRQENRTLKRISVKQERELKRVDREEGSLPQLLERHSAEMRTYRERLKKNKQDILRKEKESHSHDTELTKLRDKLQHYKELDNNKKLEERAALARKLEKVENALAERDTKILELQKTIKLSEKARQREIKEHQDRYKKTKDELMKVQENVLSLREKLKEKEKQLDMTNIYHQNIHRKFKKVNPLALPPAYEEDSNTRKEVSVADTSLTAKKRTNIFLTNDVSDTSSNMTAEAGKSVIEVPVEKKNGSLSDADKSLEFEKQQAARLKEEIENEERRKKEEEEAMKKEEEKRKREDQEMKEKIRQLEEEKRRKEQQEMMELERKKKEEEERLRKEKEDQARLKFKEDEETRRKKDLLLARMKAIDADEGKPNGIIDMDLNSKSNNEKPKKLPIFLQSTDKPKQPPNEPSGAENEKRKFGSSSSVRSKHSKDSSHDVKESFQNLHHGLPAHPSDQHFRARRNSQDDDLAFGSYKPTVGRHKEGNSKPETFGSYNPSFAESTNRKNSGLDFGKKQEKKQDKPNDVVFGSYQPTFGSKPSDSLNKNTDSIGALDFSSKKNEGRRARANQPNSIFGDDLFNDNKPKRTSVIDTDPFGSPNAAKDKNYPWEKNVRVSNDKDDDSLLPRRPKLNQSLNQGPKKHVPAVGNILNGTFEDDLEEVTL